MRIILTSTAFGTCQDSAGTLANAYSGADLEEVTAPPPVALPLSLE